MRRIFFWPTLAMVCAQQPALADSPPFLVSKVKLQGKGDKLSLQYRLKAVRAQTASSGKNRVALACDYCGLWYEGVIKRDPPVLAAGASSAMTAAGFRWRDVTPPRASTCKVSWSRWNKARVKWEPVARYCIRRGRARAGDCVTAVPYSRRRCRKVREAARKRRAAARRKRLAAAVSRMPALKVLGPPLKGGSSISGGRSSAFSGGGGIFVGKRRTATRAKPSLPEATARSGCYRVTSGKIYRPAAVGTVQRAMPAFRAAFQKALKRNSKTAAARLDVDATIKPSGKVTAFFLGHNVDDETLLEHFRRLIYGLPFPSGKGQVEFTFCVELTPGRRADHRSLKAKP